MQRTEAAVRVQPQGAHTDALDAACGIDHVQDRDLFEKEAVRQLRTGNAYFDRVENRDDGRYLRAATALPVVLEKCAMCHENYKQAKPGQAIGMLSYTLKIE
jgi:hypothetical protein